MAMVKLGGVEYELRPIPLRPARELRKKITSQVQGLAQMLSGLDKVEINKVEDVGELVRVFGGTLAGSVDTIADWVFDFSAELREDRERIEENTTDEEMMKAFWEVLKMLYPFGGMMGQLSGLAAQATLMNSRSANGGYGRTK